jgi:hypothetical protein
MNNPPEGCKPFNLEHALAGDPVVTRNGKPVTQITKFNICGTQIVCGVLEEQLVSWCDNGRYYSYSEVPCDLFMGPLEIEE